MSQYHAMRRDYDVGLLQEKDLADDPMVQFQLWFEQARTFGLQNGESRPEIEANAMVLATANSKGQPSARMVLLKEVNPNGFVFFGNYQSQKFSDLVENPKASLLFYWDHMARQVRIEGLCQKISTAESDRYFQSRPYESQIGAWASQQSKPLASRAALEAKVEEYRAKYPKDDAQGVPRPNIWGGYQLYPTAMEFWQGHKSRLHDRFLYRTASVATAAHKMWTMMRLNP